MGDGRRGGGGGGGPSCSGIPPAPELPEFQRVVIRLGALSQQRAPAALPLALAVALACRLPLALPLLLPWLFPALPLLVPSESCSRADADKPLFFG